MRGAGGSDPGTPAGSHRSSGNTPPIAPAANARAPRPRNPTARAPDFGLTFPDTCVCLLRRLDVTSHPRRWRCSAPAHLSPGCGRGLGWEAGRAVSVRPGARCPVFPVAEPVCTQVLRSVKSGRPLRHRGAGPGRCSHLDGAVTARATRRGVPAPRTGWSWGRALPLVAEPPAALGTRSAQGPPLLRAALPGCLHGARRVRGQLGPSLVGAAPGRSCRLPIPSLLGAAAQAPAGLIQHAAVRVVPATPQHPSLPNRLPGKRWLLEDAGAGGRGHQPRPEDQGPSLELVQGAGAGPLGCCKPRPTRSLVGSWAEQAEGAPSWPRAGPADGLLVLFPPHMLGPHCCPGRAGPTAARVYCDSPATSCAKKIKSLAMVPTQSFH